MEVEFDQRSSSFSCTWMEGLKTLLCNVERSLQPLLTLNLGRKEKDKDGCSESAFMETSYRVTHYDITYRVTLCYKK